MKPQKSINYLQICFGKKQTLFQLKEQRYLGWKLPGFLLKFLIVNTEFWQRRASDKALVLLCEGENSITGRQKVDGYWKDIQAALKRSCVIGTIPYLEARALGHYQEPTAVIEGPNSLVGQPSAEFYQTIFYGTVRKRGSRNVTAVSSFYINEVDEQFTLHFGIAQCSIPSQKMLDKKGDLPRAKGFVSKLFEGKKRG